MPSLTCPGVLRAPAGPGAVACVDVGSTHTKAALVELPTGRLIGTSAHRTTIDTDVMVGVEACLQGLSGGDADRTPVLVCSSAGGGLRIAVVGNEQLITAEAGRTVALSSGGHVVAVLAGELDEAALETLSGATPDVVLLVGGTDGGNPVPLLGAAGALASHHQSFPVVVAGNAEATPRATARLTDAGVECVQAGNVMPRVGLIDPGPARAALREVFLRHVIGGKDLSEDPRFAELVKGPTPDAVLQAVELLAAGVRPGEGAGDLVLVDVGGATTDVYSAVRPAGREEPVVSRTVEGDLGVRWSAVGTVAAATQAGWVSDPEAAEEAAQRLRGAPALLAESPDDVAFDEQLASWAIGLALRRHAGRARPRYLATGTSTGRWVERSGVDLREVRLVVGSGGVLRHGIHRTPTAGERFLSRLDATGGWQLPRAAAFAVDTDYVVAAAGLLAQEHPDAAWALLEPLRTRAGTPGL